MMDAITALKTRRSIRTYLDKPIDKETLADLVDCGRLAASARNLQPCRFVVITDKAGLCAIAQMTDYGKFIAQASACIAVFGEDVTYRIEDCAAAAQNILVAAKAHGLASCWVAGDKKAYATEAERALGAPEGMKLFCLIALGSSDAESQVQKKPIEDVLFWEHF